MGALETVLPAQLAQGNQHKIALNKDLVRFQTAIEQPLLHGIQNKSVKVRAIQSLQVAQIDQPQTQVGGAVINHGYV
jgi:hypothetical protein